MSYSLSKHPNAPYEFPEPPQWLVWIQGNKWDSKTRTYTLIAEGQVRHVSDLSKAKKRVSVYTRWDPVTYARQSEVFTHDWAIYLWDKSKGEYVLQHEGRKGARRDSNALFKEVLRGAKKHQPRPGLEEEVEAALASISRAVS